MLNLAKTMAAAVPNVVAPPPAPVYAPPAQVPSLSLADEFLLRPEDATKKVADQVFAERMAPAMQGMTAMASQYASVQRHLAAQQYATEFQKYGPEIDTMMANVPPEARTLENYEKVVTFIRGKYINEFASAAIARQTGLGERSGGGGQFGTPNPTGVDFGKLPQGMGKVAERVGLTETQVLDFCKATNITPQQWMEQAMSEKVVTSVAPFSFQVRPEQVGVKRGFDA